MTLKTPITGKSLQNNISTSFLPGKLMNSNFNILALLTCTVRMCIISLWPTARRRSGRSQLSQMALLLVFLVAWRFLSAGRKVEGTGTHRERGLKGFLN